MKGYPYQIICKGASSGTVFAYPPRAAMAHISRHRTAEDVAARLEKVELDWIMDWLLVWQFVTVNGYGRTVQTPAREWLAARGSRADESLSLTAYEARRLGAARKLVEEGIITVADARKLVRQIDDDAARFKRQRELHAEITGRVLEDKNDELRHSDY